MIRSLRGARGGIWLAKLPQEIKLSEVVKLLEGSIDPVDCVNNPEPVLALILVLPETSGMR